MFLNKTLHHVFSVRSIMEKVNTQTQQGVKSDIFENSKHPNLNQIRIQELCYPV
jgi:hypothetical protein